MKHNSRVNIPMCLACVLFCLTILSFYFTNGLYAKYSSNIKDNENATQTAQMINATKVIIEKEIMIAPGETQNINFNVSNVRDGNVCEVDLKYKIEVALVEQNLPLEWKLLTGEGDSQHEGILESQTETVVPYTLEIHWPEFFNNEAYSFEIDVLQIIITAEQID